MVNVLMVVFFLRVSMHFYAVLVCHFHLLACGKAAQLPQYSELVDAAIAYAKEKAGPSEGVMSLVLDKLFVTFGAEILKCVEV